MHKIRFSIGEVTLGGDSPIVVQTMCNTHTCDIERSVAQCRTLSYGGAELIRLTTQGLQEVDALRVIKERLRSEGIKTPIVADIHFNSQVAIEAAKVADKVRINPGNFATVHKDATSQFAQLIAVCKEYGTALRIGINHGSLGEEITNRYGNSPKGMAEAAIVWLNMCAEHDFERVVVSLKASNTQVMSTAYRLLYKAMREEGTIYPLHIGVTEAGGGDTGRIKSAIGTAALLREGIGETIRVSLTEDPLREIVAGRTIVDYFESGEFARVQSRVESQLEQGISTPCIKYSDLNITDREGGGWNEFIIKASCTFGTMLLEKEIDDFEITGHPFSKEKIARFKEDVQQGARRRFSHPEYIACPGCGRTMYNIEKSLAKVKERTSHLKGIKIAVMGCIVNGPGEMADADFGYVGQGGGKVTIYKGKEPFRSNVPQEQAVDVLIELIESSIK